MARNVAEAGVAKMEAAGSRRGWQQTWPGHGQCRTPAVIPGAAPRRLRLGWGRQICKPYTNNALFQGLFLPGPRCGRLATKRDYIRLHWTLGRWLCLVRVAVNAQKQRRQFILNACLINTKPLIFHILLRQTSLRCIAATLMQDKTTTVIQQARCFARLAFGRTSMEFGFCDPFLITLVFCAGS